MTDEVRQLVDAYAEWLRRGISAEAISDDLVEITTPFLDRHNDHLQVYAKRLDGRFVISDEGETIADLVASGVDVRQVRRRQMIEGVARGFGVQSERGTLQVEATQNQLGRRMHSLIQAMLAVNDMYVLARSRIESFFLEDVQSFLTSAEVRFTPRVKLAGKSGYDHSVDFLVPRSSRSPDRVVQAVSNPNKATVSNVLFGISDVKAARSDDLWAYAMLDDRDHEVVADVVEAFAAYDVKATMWSERSSVVELLLA